MQTGLSPLTSGKLANLGFVCACLVVAIHVRVEAEAGNACWWFCGLLKDGVARMAVPFFFATAAFCWRAMRGRRAGGSGKRGSGCARCLCLT